MKQRRQPVPSPAVGILAVVLVMIGASVYFMANPEDTTLPPSLWWWTCVVGAVVSLADVTFISLLFLRRRG